MKPRKKPWPTKRGWKGWRKPAPMAESGVSTEFLREMERERPGFLDRQHEGGWITESEKRAAQYVSPEDFIAWLRELSADPKWKGRPTEWDDHQFRVSVQRELRRVR